MSESVLSLASQLSKLLLLEFEALKVQDLDRFESLQPGKNDLLAGLAKLCPSAEDLQNLPEHKELRELLIESRDLHRRNAVLIERKLDTIRGTLHSLHTGEMAALLKFMTVWVRWRGLAKAAATKKFDSSRLIFFIAWAHVLQPIDPRQHHCNRRVKLTRYFFVHIQAT